MEIRFRNYLDCASIKEAFENDITFSMMKKAVEYNIKNNIVRLEETNIYYLTNYNNVINIRYEVMNIFDNKAIIDIYDFYIDYSYSIYNIDSEIEKFKHKFKEV